MTAPLPSPAPETWTPRESRSTRERWAKRDPRRFSAYVNAREAFRAVRAANVAALDGMESAWVSALASRAASEQAQIEAHVARAWPPGHPASARHPFCDVLRWWTRRRKWHEAGRCPRRPGLPPPTAIAPGPPVSALDPDDYVGGVSPCAWCASFAA